MTQLSHIPKTRIAFIKAEWHKTIVDQSYKAFDEVIKQHLGSQAIIDVFDVPGAMEIPLLAKNLAETKRYAAIATSAFIVDGGIYRHDFVSEAVIMGLMRAQMDTGVPVLSGVLTPHHYHDSPEHQEFFFNHFTIKGKELADACLSIIKTQASIAKAA